MRVKVMYMLEPTQAWKNFKALPKPAQKLDVEDASPEVLESMEDAANIHDEEC